MLNFVVNARMPHSWRSTGQLAGGTSSSGPGEFPQSEIDPPTGDTAALAGRLAQYQWRRWQIAAESDILSLKW